MMLRAAAQARSGARPSSESYCAMAPRAAAEADARPAKNAAIGTEGVASEAKSAASRTRDAAIGAKGAAIG